MAFTRFLTALGGATMLWVVQNGARRFPVAPGGFGPLLVSPTLGDELSPLAMITGNTSYLVLGPTFK